MVPVVIFMVLAVAAVVIFALVFVGVRGKRVALHQHAYASDDIPRLPQSIKDQEQISTI